MMGVFAVLWFLRNRSYSKSKKEKPLKVTTVIFMILITAILFTALYFLSQPMCPKSEQRTIHIPAIKGETSMTSHEAYDYIVCVKQDSKH